MPDDLNPPQRQAVEHGEGPLLVLAGPGSGKTRVITRRIARLVERGVDPGEILAITFTNKAAREMAERVDRLMPGSNVWVSTFHRFCARVLRRFAPAVGLSRNYTIFDTADQRQLLKAIYADLGVDSHHYSPMAVSQRISQAKNELLTAEDFARSIEEVSGDYFNRVVSDVYKEYERLLLEANAVDFDDLLMHVCRLFHEHDEIRSELDRAFRFVLVDEYQDTNTVQYRIVRALSHDYPNVCVTGDPDQSIYRWRGADVGNILKFEKDYPNTVVVRLEQNYRSTKGILRAADELIGHNVKRKKKSLFTENEEGHVPELLCFADQVEESRGMAELIRHLGRRENRSWSHFAVVYRVNALSRSMELALTSAGIPYQVAGGVAFYERTEIKDLLAYLRLIFNPADRAAFDRVVNVPARGIGKKSLVKLLEYAQQNDLTPLQAAAQTDKVSDLPKKAAWSLKRFAGDMDELSRRPFTGLKDVFEAVLSRTRYRDALTDSGTEDDAQRVANVDELVTAAAQYDEQHPDDSTMEGFLETASLSSEVDNVDERLGKVTLLTLHSAKGLEFPVVFVLGVEQNLLPHERTIKSLDRDELEEERRLLFVGMTRARERLYLTQTWERSLRGVRLKTITSQFLAELGETLQWKTRRDGGWETVSPRELAGEALSPQGGEDPAITGHKQRLRDLALNGGNRPLLTSGAALLSRGKDTSQAFEPGKLVRHPRYGVGNIVQTSGTGKNLTVTVQFEEGQPMQFRVHMAPLQPVGL